MKTTIREELADYAHNAWANWMEYMFSKCEDVEYGVHVPAMFYDRWTRQKNTKYADLPETEKKSDRDEADKIIKIVMEYLTESN